MSKITLILGGARSGKSNLAEKLARQRAGDSSVLYVATLETFDEELRQRALQHRASRPASWPTLEAPFALTAPLLATLKAESLVLVDCITVWSSNRLLEAGGMLAGPTVEPSSATSPASEPPDFSLDYAKLELELTTEISQLISELRTRQLDLILVSNEVGLGLVPPYPIGRAYRDLLGRLNQYIAAQADEVLLVWAGIPVDLKRWQANLT
jgi:adenosylcobinamide kinase/adenosylcobinamide-phosphate guanylyltransferase